MKYYITLLIYLVLIVPSFAQNDDIQLLRKNLLDDALLNKGYAARIERYIKSDYSKAKQYLKEMNKAGAWSDIDYTDRDNKWNPLYHLDRILVMSYNYMSKDAKLYQNKKLLEGTERAISYWYKVNPECDNWYKNKIAKQFYFNVIALLLDGEIDDTLHAKMVNDLTEKPTMTGSNRTLLATSTFYKGVLTNNSEMIKLGVSGVTDQIKVTTDEGVQPDFSFHQHGKFLYNGSYGFNFLRESAWLATIVHGTKFDYSEAFIKVLRDYYLKGTRWMIRNNLIDYNVRGRQVGRADAMKLYADLLIPILNHLSIADPEYANEYKKSIRRIELGIPQPIEGLKHFWRSDYSIVHRKDYSISLKMCSERTVGIELNMNSENKLGYWLPYGLTYIYKAGNEYDGIFPVWDWARLPGVTNPYIEIEEKGKGVAYSQKTSFVGGVSNGKYGVSAMDFSMNQTKAKKAWFWFEDQWVALGAGIESSHDSSIVTSVNQCVRNGGIMYDEKDADEALLIGPRTSLKNASWVLHDKIGYVFPGNQKIEFYGNVQSGNMQRIYGLGKDSIYSKSVFSLWFDHGKNPVDAKYEYIVIPETDKKQLNDFIKNPPIWILLNSEAAQAVYHKTLDITGIVLYQKGEIITEQFELKVDNPCIVMVDLKNNEISICDPSAKLRSINFNLKFDEAEDINKNIDLPQNGFAGKSVTLKLQ